MFNATVFTIFPELFPGFLGYSLTGKALEDGLWSINTVNIRDYAIDKHGSVDDTPCGGGAGMVQRQLQTRQNYRHEPQGKTSHPRDGQTICKRRTSKYCLRQI